MTDLLDKAIARARRLPADEQNEIAEIIMTITSEAEEVVHLDPETRVAVDDGLEQARRGVFANEEKVAAAFDRR